MVTQRSTHLESPRSLRSCGSLRSSVVHSLRSSTPCGACVAGVRVAIGPFQPHPSPAHRLKSTYQGAPSPGSPDGFTCLSHHARPLVGGPVFLDSPAMVPARLARRVPPSRSLGTDRSGRAARSRRVAPAAHRSGHPVCRQRVSRAVPALRSVLGTPLAPLRSARRQTHSAGRSLRAGRRA
jgi:hypothetical protein